MISIRAWKLASEHEKYLIDDKKIVSVNIWDDVENHAWMVDITLEDETFMCVEEDNSIDVTYI
jgi:hypothetical protein